MRISRHANRIGQETNVSKKAPQAKRSRTRPARATRGSISAEQIIAGAMEVSREGGIDALSMPKLAEHLGIGVTSIYWYFRTKQELIEALTVRAAKIFHGLIEANDESAPWDERLTEAFLRLRRGMKDDPVSCDLLFLRGGRASEGALNHMWPGTEQSLAKMVEAGFTPQGALQNIVTLSLFTRGCIVLERQMLRDGIAPDAPTPVPESYTVFTRALEGQNTRGVSDTAYEAQLRALIEGMKLRLKERQPT